MYSLVSLIFPLLVILSTKLQCNCSQENENFTIIYAVEGKVFARKSGEYKAPIKLQEFNADVTDFAIHNNYLYTSVKRRYLKDSAIWRVKATYLTDNDSWQEFHILNVLLKDMNCVATANGTIYAGVI